MHVPKRLLPVVVTLVGCCAAGLAQSDGSMAARASASVVVTTITHSEADGTPFLDVAVFWRGTPGWFTASEPGRQSGGGASTVLADGRPGPQTHFIGVGNLRLEVRFEPDTGLARIQGQSISPPGANVVLVDDVDGAAGPTIVDSMRTEPRFPGGVDVDRLVRRHPALLSFLRCEARFPDQPQHSPVEVGVWRQMTDLSCARLRSVVASPQTAQ